ncbi:unnamed protein product [Discula destructiva]
MATTEHGLYCFESLAATLEKRTPLSLADVQTSYDAYRSHLQNSHAPSSSSDKITDPDARYPLFVTWDQEQPPQGSGTYHLRGCIGTFRADDPLSQCLAEYARISALHDERFAPVALAELPSLQCAVTLLTDFEECADMHDWEVGAHGIKIAFREHGVPYSGTYLPSVAPEQGWDKDETLLSLMRKAGWRGSRSKWREVAEATGMVVVRYQGNKTEVTYAEFEEWRDWVSAHWKAGD